MFSTVIITCNHSDDEKDCDDDKNDCYCFRHILISIVMLII
jgi:hypothetical protein